VLQDEYLIDIFHRDERLVCGLRFMRTFALTAAHRLGDIVTSARRQNGLRLKDGTPVLVEDFYRPSDLALLRLVPDDDVPMPRAQFAPAKRDEPWRTTYQLADGSKILYGSVADPDAVYRRSKTLEVKALRLQVDSSPEGHSDYAGSPIERVRQSGSPVALGLLVEPRPHQDVEGIAPFAGTLAEAFRIFKHILLPGSAPGAERPDVAEGDSRANVIEKHLDKAGLINIVRVDWTQ
jgi:hypothetical protein